MFSFLAWTAFIIGGEEDSHVASHPTSVDAACLVRERL
jgi:hypothetical protein